MTTRRTFITALALAPIVIAAPASAAGTVAPMKAHWDMMMQRKVDAFRAHLQFSQRVYDPIVKEIDELFGYPIPNAEKLRALEKWSRYAEYDAAGTESERLCSAAVEAEYAMLHVEAPDLPALLWKIEMALDDDGDLPERHRLAILKDARRLLV